MLPGLLMGAFVLIGSGCGQPSQEAVDANGTPGASTAFLTQASTSCADDGAVPLPSSVSAYLKSNPETSVVVMRAQPIDTDEHPAPVIEVLQKSDDRVLQVPAIPAGD